MFDLVDEERSHPREDSDEALWRELGEIADREARDKQRVTELLRLADERGVWKRAGFSSLAQWFAQAFRCDYPTARRVTEVAAALRALPALDEAMSCGAMTLDQVAAATPYATPETEAEIARMAVGKAPSEIARAARTIVPPTVADDQALRQRRALSMTWVSGGRELAFNGRLPLEHGVAFEQAIWNIAKPHRAADKKAGLPVLEWSQYTADALVSLATRPGGAADDGVRRSPTTVIVHLSADEPPMLEGAGPISVETADRLCCDARRLTIKPSGDDLVHSRITRCASYPQMRALYKRANGHCQYPGCTVKHELRGHHLQHESRGGKAVLENMILLCSRHHDLVHDDHIRTTGTGKHPIFTSENGRLITTDQPHAPPR